MAAEAAYAGVGWGNGGALRFFAGLLDFMR
jgi:hypothetical protein